MLKPFILFLIALLAASLVSADTLRRGNTAEPETLDPQKSFTDPTGNIVLDLFVGLTTYDTAANPIPGTAESWTISPDGTTYTFKLRQNQLWSDGTPVTAEDIAFGVRRAVDPKTAAELVNLVFCIKNSIPVNAGKMPLDQLGLRVVDKATIEIKTEGPCPTLLAGLAEPAFTAMPTAAFKKYGDDWIKPGKMVSNGPFTLAEWRANDHVRLVKNPRFYDAAHVKLDEVIYYPTEDDASALKRLRAGEIDLNIRISPGDIGWLKAKMPAAVHTTVASGTNYVIINHRAKKFQDVRVRRALMLALDRDMMTAGLTKLGETPAYGLIPPLGHGYTNQSVDFAKMPLAQRQAEARKLLAAAGYTAAKPLAFTLRQRSGVANQRVAIALQNQWAQVGMKVDILVTELKSHYASMNANDFDVGVATLFWPPDPEYFLADFLKTAGTNYGRYDNPAFDAKVHAAQREAELAKRYAGFAEAEAILLKDAAFVPLYYSVTRNVVAPQVKGFVDNLRDFHMSRFMQLAKPTAAR